MNVVEKVTKVFELVAEVIPTVVAHHKMMRAYGEYILEKEGKEKMREKQWEIVRDSLVNTCVEMTKRNVAYAKKLRDRHWDAFVAQYGDKKVSEIEKDMGMSYGEALEITENYNSSLDQYWSKMAN